MKRVLPLVMLLLMMLLLLSWYWRGSGSQELPALRIICRGNEQQLACPSSCEVDEGNQVTCRCQDIYQRGEDGLMHFSHEYCDK